MKIRIHGNSVRFRLSKPEVEQLSMEGILEEKTVFPENEFTYSVKRDPAISTLSASFEKGKITLAVPAGFTLGWAENDVTGFDANVVLNDQESLYLLLEKDFKCLDNVLEDQSDNYENPNKIC